MSSKGRGNGSRGASNSGTPNPAACRTGVENFLVGAFSAKKLRNEIRKSGPLSFLDGEIDWSQGMAEVAASAVETLEQHGLLESFFEFLESSRGGGSKREELQRLRGVCGLPVPSAASAGAPSTGVVGENSDRLVLTLSGTIAEFSEQQKASFLRAVHELLELDGCIRIVQVAAGSIKVTLEGDPKSLAILMRLALQGQIAGYDVLAVDWNGVHREIATAGRDTGLSIGTLHTPPLPSADVLVIASSGHRTNAGSRGNTLGPAQRSEGEAPKVPARLGKYRVLERLGEGGVGVVFKGYDADLDRLAVVKVAYSPDEVMLSRFRREAELGAKLRHTGICQVYEVARDQGIDYIAMEFIPGTTLHKYIAASRPMTQSQIVGIIQKLALAMSEAHRKGVIHCDLKPSNVMVSESRPYVMDFGLAKDIDGGAQTTDAATTGATNLDRHQTSAVTIVGTLPYMSPEQVQGQELTVATDIYSLGVILYEMLTRRLPFQEFDDPSLPDDTLLQLAISISPPPPPSNYRLDIHPELERVCLKMLAKTPSDRYSSMREVADELKRVHELSNSQEAPLQNAARRSYFPIIATIAIVVILAVLAWYVLFPPIAPAGWPGLD